MVPKKTRRRVGLHPAAIETLVSRWATCHVLRVKSVATPVLITDQLRLRFFSPDERPLIKISQHDDWVLGGICFPVCSCRDAPKGRVLVL